jgi:hypothetical protein
MDKPTSNDNERKEEEILIKRIERVDATPSESIPWKDIRRTNKST